MSAIGERLRPRRPVGVVQSEVDRINPGPKPKRKIERRVKAPVKVGRLPPPPPIEPPPKRKIVPRSEVPAPTIGRWERPPDARAFIKRPIYPGPSHGT